MNSMKKFLSVQFWIKHLDFAMFMENMMTLSFKIQNGGCN